MSPAAQQQKAIGLMLFLLLFLLGCDEQILHDLSEQDANKVISRLGTGRVDAKKVLQSDGRWAISVSRDSTVPALAFLETNRVLAPRAAQAGSATKSGFVPSREEQWFRYERSVASSIEDSLGTVRGVLEARVHLNLPETDPLFGTRRESIGSGSVLLVIDEHYSSKDEEIAALVGGAAGIPSTKVNVLRSLARFEKTTELPKVESSNFNEYAEPATLPKAPSSIIARVAVITRSAVISGALTSVGIAVLLGAGVMLLARRQKRVRFPLPQAMTDEA